MTSTSSGRHGPPVDDRVALTLAAVVLLVAGCTGGGASGGGASGAGTTARVSPRTASPSATGGAPGTTGTGGRTGTAAVTTTLPVMPTPSASSPAGVDASAIHTVADLPAAFGCTPAVAPITLPASADTPEGRICVSRIAGNEALFLFHHATPEERLAALTAASRLAKYVHAGPNWVAGGSVDPRMGGVGGEVYR